MIREVDNFYFSREEPYRSCLLVLRELIHKQDVNMTETLKYGIPCFCYKKKICCYLWMDKKTKEPYILFAEGTLLNHPKLEQGNRKRMKIFRVNPNENIPIRTINMILKDALDLYKKGIIPS